MKVDRNEFFREITLRICGSLEIEKGLFDCFQYISQHIPTDSLYLEKYEKNLGSMRVIVRADSEKGEKMDVLIPLGKDANAVLSNLGKVLNAGNLPSVIVINKPEEEPVTRHMLEIMGEPMSSALSLPLIIENRVVGTLALLAEGNDRFTDYHAELYSMLKEPFFTAMSNTLKHEEVVKLKNLLADDNRYLQQELLQKSGDNIVGSNFGLKGIMDMVRQIASHNSPVLLLGETGTGKDLIANAIHYSSARRDGPFIGVNCGAIPESLIDSELFGHEKGAFTGALAQKRGRFERAQKGTIFLDEVGELPMPVQIRLLRVLQNKEIERVGGTKTIPLDIRIIAATNKDLKEMVNNNSFREDLWFRLNVFPVSIPPLRERKVDIPALLQHFIMKKAKELKLSAIPEIEHGSLDILTEYSWPGNVRELENIVERALILNKTGLLSFKHLYQKPDNTSEAVIQNNDEIKTLDELVSTYIKKILIKTGGKIHGTGGAAEFLGINASTLRNKMNKLGINYRKG